MKRGSYDVSSVPPNPPTCQPTPETVCPAGAQSAVLMPSCLQGESKRIHPGMAGAAKGFAAVEFEDFTQGRFTIAKLFFGLFEQRHIGRWRRRGHPHDIVQEEETALHG